MRGRGIALAALMAAGCTGGSDGRYGLEQRTPVSGLELGGGPGQAALVDAFPLLGFAQPVLLAHPPDGTDRIVVVEREGTVRIFPNEPGASAAAIFLDLRAKVLTGGERGLLGLAFHPDYATNGLVYVCYSAAAVTPGADHTSVLSRFAVSADPNALDPVSEELLLEIAQPYSNHNGGMLAFGPDAKLYVSVGDGGAGGDPGDVAQDLGSLLGKLLRLEDDGSAAADNPFVGSPGARPEIWAYGLRNPWRFGFDRATGELWVGDVGQNHWEEIDLVTAGDDLGWDTFEGAHDHENPDGLPLDSSAPPVHEYGRELGASVTGGTVYRGALYPDLVGAYIYADFISGRVWALTRDGGEVTANVQIATVTNPAGFGEDEAGELYVCSFDGRIYRFEPQPGVPSGLPQRMSETGIFVDMAALTPAPGLIEYEVNAELWSDGARKRRWLALPGTERIGFDPTEAWSFPLGTVLVKHFELEVAPGVWRRLETRALVLHASGWQGHTWRWDEAQTEAWLVEETTTAEIAIEGGEPLTWSWFASADCLVCHTQATGRVLGARTRQLNREFDYPALTDNQLRAWNHIGLFTEGIGAPEQYERQAPPHEDGAPLAGRARSYLAANCAMCHRPDGPTPVALDLRYGIAASELNAVGVPPSAGDLGIEGALLVDPGSRATSVLWERMRRLDGTRMPPLASHRVDAAALELVGQWIDAGAP